MQRAKHHEFSAKASLFLRENWLSEWFTNIPTLEKLSIYLGKIYQLSTDLDKTSNRNVLKYALHIMTTYSSILHVKTYIMNLCSDQHDKTR